MLIEILKSPSFLSAVFTVCCTLVLFIVKEIIDITSCYFAIMTELKVLKEIFETTFLKEIDNAKSKEILWLKYPLGTDYFTMYNTNCEKIGRIPIPKLRTLIVSSYTLAKYFLDCLKTNNECIQFYEDIELGRINVGIENAEYALRHSFNNNIIPTAKKMRELLKYIK